MQLNYEIIGEAVKFWDETERITKRSEQINYAMIVPAISELRYAGRKLVDYLSSMRDGDDPLKSETHLQDFYQCCIRARHDAIDAIINYVAIYLDRLEDQVGANFIANGFERYLPLKENLREALNLITHSRADRKQRNDYYSRINETLLDPIMTYFEELQSNKPAIFSKRREADFRYLAFKLMMFFALAALLSLIVLSAILVTVK